MHNHTLLPDVPSPRDNYLLALKKFEQFLAGNPQLDVQARGSSIRPTLQQQLYGIAKYKMLPEIKQAASAPRVTNVQLTVLARTLNETRRSVSEPMDPNRRDAYKDLLHDVRGKIHFKEKLRRSLTIFAAVLAISVSLVAFGASIVLFQPIIGLCALAAVVSIVVGVVTIAHQSRQLHLLGQTAKEGKSTHGVSQACRLFDRALNKHKPMSPQRHRHGYFRFG